MNASELWGLNGSTLRKAISYGKPVNGVDVCKFGKQWVVSMDSMQREYGARPDRAQRSLIIATITFCFFSYGTLGVHKFQ